MEKRSPSSTASETWDSRTSKGNWATSGDELANEFGASLEIVEGADHTFRPLWTQDSLQVLVEDALATAGIFKLESASSPADFSKAECGKNSSHGSSLAHRRAASHCRPRVRDSMWSIGARHWAAQ